MDPAAQTQSRDARRPPDGAGAAWPVAPVSPPAPDGSSPARCCAACVVGAGDGRQIRRLSSSEALRLRAPLGEEIRAFVWAGVGGGDLEALRGLSLTCGHRVTEVALNEGEEAGWLEPGCGTRRLGLYS